MNGNRYFCHSFIRKGTIVMYLEYSCPLIYHLVPNIWMASYTVSASIFVEEPHWPNYSTDKSISSVVPGPSHFVLSLWRRHRNRMDSEQRPLVVQNPIILRDNARSHTAAITDLLRCWQWEILEHPLYSPNMRPWDYDLFAKVKESLWGTWYNTRDELIHTIGWSIRINKDGRADGVKNHCEGPGTTQDMNLSVL